MSEDEDELRRKMAEGFKEGWERAGREGAVAPNLQAALQENLGIHPDRAQAYLDARMDFRAGRGPEPDPKDYQDPVVVPMRKDSNPYKKK